VQIFTRTQPGLFIKSVLLPLKSAGCYGRAESCAQLVMGGGEDVSHNIIERAVRCTVTTLSCIPSQPCSAHVTLSQLVYAFVINCNESSVY